ncbi:MAG TPA: HAMP domain-containing sensor histidine kinase [Chloroflexota bacterium]|nr:HAMP domain-containing sensor histidine kinase [Chloroflexota bacterium]
MRQALFSSLRLHLTLLYLLAGLILVGLVGASAYGLLSYYFNSTTDLALQYEMGHAFQAIHAPLPPAIVAADAAWSASRSGPTIPPLVQLERSDGERPPARRPTEGADAELAAVYALPLDASGAVITLPNFSTATFTPDVNAAKAALVNGSDLRTTSLSDGTPVRLLTYRVDQNGGPALLQLGRPLTDQERILQNMLVGLLALGGACTVLVTLISWWLAGRSLQPAQDAWDRQQAFVANAGHELRAPLTLMRASADVALRELPNGDDDQRELWTDVLQECDHMARLVEDLLLLSRLDSGRLVLKPQSVVFSDLLADLRRQVGRVADERGVDLLVDAESVAALADPERLRQVLLILIDNALRHTPSGGQIRLVGRLEGRLAHLIVADTGEGIPAAHLARIFDRFYVVDGARRSGGTGLGLSIAKGLVEAQHGEIRLASQVGHGTTVEIVLPRATKD